MDGGEVNIVVQWENMIITITMNISRIKNPEQLSAITSALEPVVEPTMAQTIKERYLAVEGIARQFGYDRKSVSKKDRQQVINLCVQTTNLSRSRVKHLLARYRENGRLIYTPGAKHRFVSKYTTDDVAKLVETDNALRRMSGQATVRVFDRMYRVYGNSDYEQLSRLSVSHLYNLRETRQYQSQSLITAGTKSVSVPIGRREKPQTGGKPGFLRVDSVHQGDLGKVKGVYFINLVDEVTQWEIVACVPNICEESMKYILGASMSLFPFPILGFHSDNGGEYINYTVAWLLKKIKAEQTKSRSRRTNDNALPEGKNAWVIRKHFGHGHIAKKHAELIHEYLTDWFVPFLNFHRPCAFATEVIEPSGKIKKKYDTWLTPFEKLKSLEAVDKLLKPGALIADLEQMEQKYDDVTFAELKEKKHKKLFKNLS